MINKIYPGPLVGEEIEIIESTNQRLKGLCGVVEDETKETLSLKVSQKTVVVLKAAVTIKLTKTNKVLLGSKLQKRPEDRIKGR